MIATPHDMPAAFAAAFNERSVDRLLALYADDAVLIADGVTEVPAAGLRAALEGFLALPGPMKMTLKRAVTGAESAVVVAEWSLPNGMSGTTSDVLRRSPTGGWQYVIDAPFGIKA